MKLLLFILATTCSIPSFGKNFKKCYVTFELNGFKDQEKFTVYVQNKSDPNYYFGFEISHELDTSEIVFSNQYRLQRGDIYKFNGNRMQATGLTALATGESECVYRASNTVDFTGGFHGDEQLISVAFYIDGVQLSTKDLAANFYLKPCTEFSYIQKSNMYSTFRKDDTIQSAQQPEAMHVKKSIFRNSGYDTHNRLEWIKSTCINIAYLSIASIGIDMGEFCQSNHQKVYKLDRASNHKSEGIGNFMHIWNVTNGTAVTIKSILNKNDNSAIQFVWDHSHYNKYYRNAVVDTPVTVNEGEIWEGSTYMAFLIDQ